MAIWGSFSTSAMAMNTHSHHMSQIGANIANVNTTSYKAVESHYMTQMANTTSRFNFYSVNVTDVRRVDVQGMITPTGRAHDLALNGQGFFVTNTEVDGSGEFRYTRDGSFAGEQFDMGQDTDLDGQNDQGTYLIDRNGHYVMGYAANGAGGFGTALQAIQLDHNAIEPGKATENIALQANIPSANGSPDSYTTTVPITATGTGPNGLPTAEMHNLTLTFTPSTTEPNVWDVTVQGDGDTASATITPAQLRFRGDGTLDTVNGPSELSVALTWNDGSDAQTITIDMSRSTQYSGEGDLNIRKLEHDGYLTGRLKNTYFDKNGVMYGSYSNSTVRPLYKLPIATFPAPNQLEALNGNTFRATSASGDPDLTMLEDVTSVASIEAGSLEQANVNLEDQFTRMITTQRAYSSAAQVFKTSDEMLQEIRNLKR